MQDFRRLTVWAKSHQQTLRVYAATGRFPREELYGLVSHMRRAASSIPMNLAEGCGRGTDPDFARFVQIAMGSACELEYQLILANDLGYLQPDEYPEFDADIQGVKRMLASLLARLRTTQ